MGFLEAGSPLTYDETFERSEHLRLLATLELLRCYLQNVSRRDKVHMFGSECEYLLVEMCHGTREVKLMPCAPELLQQIPDPDDTTSGSYTFMPEFASYMVEGTPRNPWCLDADFGPKVQDWFLEAKRHIYGGLEKMGMKHVYPFTLTSFPLLGVPNSVSDYPFYIPAPFNVMESEFCDDILVNPHPRFRTLARNIRFRRGKKVNINSPALIQGNNAVPGYGCISVPPSSSVVAKRALVGGAKSTKTHAKRPAQMFNIQKEVYSKLSTQFLSPSHRIEDPKLREHIDNAVVSSDVREVVDAPESEPPHGDSIYMDAMVFGMGMCCLQATFSCIDEDEARYLYDQLAVLSPLFLALTASTAAFRGILSQHTTRWRVLSQSVDDRRDEEHVKVPFSRFSTVSLFISKDPFMLNNYEQLNDVIVPSRVDVYDACVSVGMDRIVARHFSAVLSRDPLVAFEEDLHAVDHNTTDAHFESFQSTNWNTVRFKPPPLVGTSYKIPWRVEFRCCESQLRDINSARMVNVIAIMVRVMLKEQWRLYMPMSLVHENMDASDSQDAITKHKFHFVTNRMGDSLETDRYTLNEIFFENEKLGLFRRCVDHLYRDLELGEISKESFNIYMDSMDFVKSRLQGTLATDAQKIRDFSLGHREYKGDGRLSQGIVYDLLANFVDQK